MKEQGKKKKGAAIKVTDTGKIGRGEMCDKGEQSVA